MNRLVPIILLLILSGCVSIRNDSAGTGYLISEIIIRNYSNTDLSNVKLKVENINGLFSCNYIISMTECSTSFPTRQYIGNEIEVTWKSDGQSISTGNIRIAVKKGLKRDNELKGIVEIRNNRQYSAFFQLRDAS